MFLKAKKNQKHYKTNSNLKKKKKKLTSRGKILSFCNLQRNFYMFLENVEPRIENKN